MKLTDAEWQIMNVLWQRYPATARGIFERLPKNIGWAYTTVKTLLTRLVNKKAVAETKKGNVSIYKPLLSQQNAQRSALKILADRAFDGAFGPLMHFLVTDQKLSKKQRRQLIRALETQHTKSKGERK